MENLIPQIISLIILILAITIHEFSHALVADLLGDPTPRSNDRLTLNPLKHLDPIGTLMMIFARFGWGKPVPIDSYNLKNPRRDETLIALAGPTSNLIVAILLSIIIRLLPINFFTPIIFSTIQLNVILAVFNLLPVPPLDGSKIFLNLLPVDKSIEWQEAFDSYGIILLLVLLFLPIGGSNMVSIILRPVAGFILSFLLP